MDHWRTADRVRVPPPQKKPNLFNTSLQIIEKKDITDMPNKVHATNRREREERKALHQARFDPSTSGYEERNKNKYGCKRQQCPKNLSLAL